MSPEEAKIIEIARNEWWTDRTPKDEAERKLMEALAEAFPDDIQTKSKCDCGQQDDCDECYDDRRVPYHQAAFMNYRS